MDEESRFLIEQYFAGKDEREKDGPGARVDTAGEWRYPRYCSLYRLYLTVEDDDEGGGR